MLPQPLDTTIAHKAINLTSELSGADKRVAGAIIDSFNRKTGQCDPSLNRIAWLLGISRRTVIRAAQRLEKLRLLRKLRHGDYSNRNSYEPNWVRFREMDAQWSVRFRAKSKQPGVINMSPIGREPCHVAGDEAGTQTCSINSSQKTCSGERASAKHCSESKPIDCKGNPIKESRSYKGGLASSESSSVSRASVATHAAAERRWNTELHRRYSATPNVYAEIIDAITPELQCAATEVEAHIPGAGLILILEQLHVRSESSAARADTTVDVGKPEVAAVCKP
jgi:hypothetical protein